MFKDSKRLQQILDAIADPTVVIDPHTFQVVLANRAARTNAVGSDPVGHGVACHRLSHCRDTPCEDAGEECPLGAVLASKAPARVTHVHFDAQRRGSVVDILASPVLSADGEVELVVESIRDITEQERTRRLLREANENLETRVKRATGALWASNQRLREEINERTLTRSALEASEKRYRALFQSLVDAVFVVDRETGSIVEVNRRAEELIGRSRGALVGAAIADLHPVGDVGRYVALFDAAARGEAVAEIEGHVRTEVAADIPARISVTALDRRDGDLVLYTIRDVSALKAAEAEKAQLEDRLRQAARLEAVGRLAGGVAHDFSNMLTVILGVAESLLATERTPAAYADGLARIRQAGERASRLTHQLLAFSRRKVVEPRIVLLNDVVREMDEMLAHLIGADIRVTALLAPDLWPVSADPSQIGQVLMNLAINARDAMSPGGELRIGTANVSVSPAEVRLFPEARPGDHVVLTVTDDGCGMDADVRAHIFEPFFTTKSAEQGTGLGLSMVYGIVRQSGGHIRVDTAPGSGTTFSIFIPRARAESQDATPTRPELGLQRAGRVAASAATVLVVDDEPLVRQLNSRLLSEAGYTVLAAATADEALEISADPGTVIDLLVTDLVMPGMSGDELARRVKAARPGTKVLCVSAAADGVLPGEDVLGSDGAFLQKPFSPARLLDIVGDLLTENATPA